VEAIKARTALPVRGENMILGKEKEIGTSSQNPASANYSSEKRPNEAAKENSHFTARGKEEIKKHKVEK